jgi:hypothetical protein
MYCKETSMVAPSEIRFIKFINAKEKKNFLSDCTFI